MTDLALLEKWVKTRDAEAFRQIAVRHAPMVFATCRRILGNPADAEEVAQECFERLVRTERGPVSNLGAWLHRVATHLALNRLKSEKRRGAREARYVAENGRYVESTWDDMCACVDEAIAELPDEFRAPVVARFLENRPYAAIASELGITRQAATKRVSRGIRVVRESLRRRGLITGTAALSALLAAQAAEAAPATLAASLGKLAIAGGPVAATGAGATSAIPAVVGGVALMAKKIAVAAAIVVAVSLLLAYVSLSRSNAPAQVPDAPRASSTASFEKTFPANSAQRAPTSAREGVAVDSQTPQQTASSSLPAAVADTPEPEPAVVAGHVTDDDGSPLADASVVIEVLAPHSYVDIVAGYHARTDSEGGYEIKGIETFGKAFTYASAPEHTTGRDYITVSAGTVREDLDFRLKAAEFFVAGRVITESKQPVSGAKIDLMYYAYDEAGLEHTAETGRTTGNISGGKFLFETSASNGYFRVAIPEEGLCDFTVTKEGHGQAFFAKVPTGTEDAEFILKSGGAIEGHVRKINGDPVAGQSVEIVGEAWPGGLSPSDVKIQSFSTPKVVVTSDASGHYRAEGLGSDYVYTVAAPGDSAELQTASSNEPGVAWIAAMLKEFDPTGYSDSLARRLDVLVKPGQTTAGVDLVIDDKGATLIRGIVTDNSSGKPASPVIVYANAADGKREFTAAESATTVTHADGSYQLVLGRLSQAATYAVSYRYMTEGGSSWPNPEDELKGNLKLKPGETRQFNFAVDAPVTAPIRFVDAQGAPMPNVKCMINHCGGQSSDAEGRVVQHGLPPGIELVARGKLDNDDDFPVGRSEPFMGAPGETLPEITVVCAALGSASAIVLDAEAKPLADTVVGCTAYPADGRKPFGGMAKTDSEGRLLVERQVPVGSYASIDLLAEIGDTPVTASIQNVEIAPGATTDLGTVTLAPPIKN